MSEGHAQSGEMIDFAVRLVELITTASTTSSYKYALLMALVDLCQENAGHAGGPVGRVTTRQVATTVLGLYWAPDPAPRVNGQRPASVE